MKLSETEVMNMLKESGLKVTEARVNILYVLSRGNNLLSAIDIYNKISRKHDIDEATLYRNLNSLLSVNLIRKYDSQEGYSKYDINDGYDYVIFTCIKCDSKEKVITNEHEDSIKRLSRKSKKFKNINQGEILVKTYCKNCK